MQDILLSQALQEDDNNVKVLLEMKKRFQSNNKDKDAVLVSPEMQLNTSNVTCGKDLLSLMFSTGSKEFSSSLFSHHFLTEKHADSFRRFVEDELMTKKIEKAKILPPLLIRSAETLSFKIGKILLVCHEKGPMIPVLLGVYSDDADIQEHLELLYNLRHTDRLTRSDFVKLVQEEK